MDIKKQWNDAINDSSKSFSITSQKGDKLSIENSGTFNGIQILKAAWLSLSLITVSAAALTVNEWSNRMDTIKQQIQEGRFENTKEVIDSQFFVKRGANFKDSFLAVADNIKNQFTFNNDEKKNISQHKNKINLVFVDRDGFMDKIDKRITEPEHKIDNIKKNKI